jgi:hypothetical protein
MSERATPETDHEESIDNGDTKPLFEFARKLERERDEARELARELRDALVSVRRQCDWDGQKVVDGLITKAKEVLP